MDKILKYLLALLVVTFSGCSFLEPIDENLLGEETVNNDPSFAEGILLKAYQDLVQQLDQTDAATDNATFNNNSSLRRIAMGEWSSSMAATSRWHHYEHILFINKFLTLIDNVQWKRDEESKQLFRDRYYGEALAMRALRHYWILQEHAGYSESGELLGIPYLDTWMEADADFNLPRLSFEETIEKIMADFNEALEYLPMDYNGDFSKAPARYANNDGGKYAFIFGKFMEHRISGRIINAYKAKLHLLAASPAFLNEQGHYEKCAEMCAKLINDNGGLAAMDMAGHHDFYTVVDDNLREYFWREGGAVDVSSANFEKDNFPPSLNGNGRINPSQSLVDAFYMANGYPAKPENGYDEQNPYTNRDPRLKLYIMYNGNDFNGRIVKTGQGAGYDALNAVAEKSTRTGYYLKKHMWENLVINQNGNTTAVKKRSYMLRYTDLFLMLAESANEIGGPGYAVGGMSAAEIIRKIRNRALKLSTDPYLDQVIGEGKDAMRDLIRNERRLELCFEGHRFYDLRRWGLLNSNLDDINGIYFSGGSYELVNVEPRDYPDYANYAPIPRSEVLKFSNLKQNKGW